MGEVGNNEAYIPESTARTRMHRSDTGNVDIVLLSAFGMLLLDLRVVIILFRKMRHCIMLCYISAFRSKATLWLL